MRNAAGHRQSRWPGQPGKGMNDMPDGDQASSAAANDGAANDGAANDGAANDGAANGGAASSTAPDGGAAGARAGFRAEHDSMGEVLVPADALWGAQTQRAIENFPIS